MMNGVEIKDILSKRLGKQFKGVYSKDEVEALQQENRPSAYVFNTRPSSEQFGHWIGIYIQRNGRAVFFDSFCRSPADLGFSNFLDKHAKTWQYNNIPIQNPFTAVCGQHVICFLLNVHNIQSWINKFCTNLLSNDKLVCRTVKSMFNVDAPLYPDVELLM